MHVPPLSLVVVFVCGSLLGCQNEPHEPHEFQDGDAFPLGDGVSSVLDGGSGSAPSGYVRIEPGLFTMGSPLSEAGRADHEVAHEVRITRAYWLKSTEVTQGEWRSVMGDNPSENPGCGDTCPVENVSWFDAVAYVHGLSQREGLALCYADGYFRGVTCLGYRLPTEAEWEYAARAGSTATSYGPIDQVAWYRENSGLQLHPVAGKSANAWGLYDMLGNVWEWTHDWYDAYNGSATDPIGPRTGNARVSRGGSWDLGASWVRAATRTRFVGSSLFSGFPVGFRPARTIP